MVNAEVLAAILTREDRPLPASELWFEVKRAGDDPSGISDVLEANPEVFVPIGAYLHDWVLVGSRFDPMRVVEALASEERASVGVLATHLGLDKPFVLKVLNCFPEVFAWEGIGPPIWRLLVAPTVARVHLHAAAPSPFRLRVASPPVKYQDSAIKRRIETIQGQLNELAKHCATLKDGRTHEYRIAELRRKLARAETSRAPGQVKSIGLEVERLDRSLRPRGIAELDPPRRQAPTNSRPGRYGKPRCGHTGRCGC